jgi:ADP-heptose:LPS heptosyltransferase
MAETATHRPIRILVLQVGGIGDLVMSVPSLRAVREAHPRAQIVLFAISRAADLLARAPYVDSVVTGPFFETAGHSPTRVLRSILGSCATLWRLRQHRPNIVVDLNAIESDASGLKRAFLILSVCSRKRVGRDTNGRGFYLTHKAEEVLLSPEHEVHRMARTVEAMGARVTDTRLELFLTQRDRAEAESYLSGLGASPAGPICGLNPCAFRPTRNWGEENFVEVGRYLRDRHGGLLVITGGPGDGPLASRVAKATGGHAAIGLSLGGLSALLARCRLLVTNDTGPMHLAAAVGTPVVAIFGPENAGRYGPFLPPERCIVVQERVDCAPCTLHECTEQGHRCMVGLDRARVFEAVDQLAAAVGLAKQRQ